jgi:cell division protein FtsI/penicillin-binding protein 2
MRAKDCFIGRIRDNIYMQNYIRPPKLAKRVLLVFALILTGYSTYGLSQMTLSKMLSPSLEKHQVAALIAPEILKNRLPASALWEDKKLDFDYTIDPVLQEYTDALLKRYRPDYGALVAIDAATGEILTMSSYTHGPSDTNLNLIATFPAASIFKIVTSAAALDMNKVTPNSTISFSGRSHTLYRRDVLNEKRNRWTRTMSLKEGFALSINCLFGKLGLYYVGAGNLLEYAHRYGFNSPLALDVPLALSQAIVPNDSDWAVVEAASGFNRLTTLSPIHGAMLAASIANDGVMMEPYLVKQAKDDNEILYRGQPHPLATPVVKQTNNELRELMRATILSGTSRKSFRKLVRNRNYPDVRFGGKTGSLSGLNPAGKTEWFVGYVNYKGRRIAIGSVLVHKTVWRARASQIASAYFERYLHQANVLENQLAKNP